MLSDSACMNIPLQHRFAVAHWHLLSAIHGLHMQPKSSCWANNTYMHSMFYADVLVKLLLIGDSGE